MYPILLSAHVLGAAATGVLALYACITVPRSFGTARQIALVFSSVATFVVMTGVALAIASPTVTTRSICDNIGLYLFFIAVSEVLLVAPIRMSGQRFPLRRVLSPIGAGIAFLLGALLIGV